MEALSFELDLLLYPVMLGSILAGAGWFARRGDLLESLTLGAGFGVIGWAALSLAHFFLLLPVATPRVVGSVAFAIAVAGSLVLAWFTRARAPRPVPSNSMDLLLVVGGIACLTLGLEASLPHYGVALRYDDWWMHFDSARFYLAPVDLNHTYGDFVVTSRTPVFNLLGSLSLATFGDRFSVFQVLTAAVGWLWALPFALVARRLVPSRAAAVTALCGLSPLILYSHTYSWPKGLAAFFCLLALERVLAFREAAPESRPGLSIQVGLFAGAAVMTHAGFVGFMLPLFGLFALDAARRRGSCSFALATITASLVALPWYAWGIAQYGVHRAVFGYPTVPYTVTSWLSDRFGILVTSMLPVSFPANLIAGNADRLQYFFLIYLGTAAGMLGVAFLVRALAQGLHRGDRLSGAHTPVLVTFAAVGILAAVVLIQGYAAGFQMAHAVLIPGILILALLALRSKPLGSISVSIAVTEMLAIDVVVLSWMWSPAGWQQGNALLAAQHGILFLGQDTWIVGIVLSLLGLAICLRPLLLSASSKASP
jgi:hypothetical protein